MKMLVAIVFSMKSAQICLLLKLEGNSFKIAWARGFPGGSGVKNSPANAGDTGSIPDPGGSDVLGSD